MALCAYHEDTEAIATCAVCKSPICDKCQEYGADGMCGMCLEMSNARKAQLESSRQARVEAAAQAPAPAGSRSPSGKTSPGGSAAAPARPGPQAPPAPASRPVPPAPAGNGKAVPPPPKSPTGGKGAPTGASRGGFCVEHDGQQLTALCTHCRKKVCPYCLDLYDLCADCRNLPHCSRHESMVSSAKCQSCNLDYCKLCLNNTPFCDRCRTLGMAQVNASKQAGRAPTGKLDPAAAEAAGQPARPPGKAGTGQLAGAPPPGARPRGKTAPLPPTKAKKGNNAAVYVIGGLVLLGAAAYVLFGDHRARLSPEEATANVRQEMDLVRAAAINYHLKHKHWPDSIATFHKQLEAQGVTLEKLNPPLKLVLNAPASEPCTIIFNSLDEGFEIKALDAEGRPLSENGRDVILTPPKPKKQAAPSTSEGEGAPAAEDAAPAPADEGAAEEARPTRRRASDGDQD